MNCKIIFLGNVSCSECDDPEEIRQFFVSPVQRTNLVLVVVEHFPGNATFQNTKKKEGVPGQPVESILYLIINITTSLLILVMLV